MNRYLFMIDRISAWFGKLFAWSVVLLTLLVCFDVTMRYILNKPNQWVFDLAYILYGRHDVSQLPAANPGLV